MNFTLTGPAAFPPFEHVQVSDAELLAVCNPLPVCEVCAPYPRRDKPAPRYVIVECGRDCEGALQEHWLSGAPVEISGVVFEMAVVARKRTWRRPMLVRGIRMG